MIVIHNPTAGPRRTRLLWDVLDILSGNGVRIQLRQTTHPGHATAIAAAAREEGAPIVVAAGGDGTIAEVAAGLAGGTTKLGIIPLGTANVLAFELGLPATAHAIAAALAFGRTRVLWPGIARAPSGQQRLFVQMVGVGLDAQVVHHMPRPLKRLFGRSAYALRTLVEMTRYSFEPIALRIDGAPATAGSVVISKGRNYAGQYVLAPDARSDAPGFSVALFQGTGAGATLLYGAALTLNVLPQAPGLRLVRAHRVEVLGGMPAQADGDAAGLAPLVVEDAPAPIAIIMGSTAAPPRSGAGLRW